MTKNEFITRLCAAKRQDRIVTTIWLVVFFGVLFGNLPLTKWLQHHQSKVWMSTVYLPVFFGFLIGNLVLTIWLTKRRIRKFGLLCPACGKPLVQATAQIAIATGNCGHCSKAIFEQ